MECHTGVFGRCRDTLPKTNSKAKSHHFLATNGSFREGIVYTIHFNQFMDVNQWFCLRSSGW